MSRDGTRLVGADGAPALARGVGIGTWLLPEGYMWRFAPAPEGRGVPAQSPREIEALVDDLVGPDRAAEFWARFRDTFFTEADVARIAAEGFDHVRLPINSRVVMDEAGRFLEDGFALVERCVRWCEAHGLHVVLDLHGAPGGQTGTNIDDSPRGRPELFTEPRYPDLTVRLWTELARRYADDPTVAAYDLLNEPLPDEHGPRHAADLVALYRRLTAAIREVDPDHLIMYEGTHWASDPAIFTEVWDDASVVQFHRYWSPPDREGIAGFLEVRDRLGLPLYMGEGGENAPDWLAAAFGLYEAEGIGWNFWTWKKVDNAHSPAVVVPPPGWADVQAYVRGDGPRPGPDDAWCTLEALLGAMALERCEWHDEVVAALLRRPPVALPAYAFDQGAQGMAYATEGARPLEGLRPSDAVTLRYEGGDGVANPFAPDPAERARAGRFTAELGPGEWVAFTVRPAAGGAHEVAVHASDEGGRPTALDVRAGETEVAGAWADGVWRGTADLPAGDVVLRVGPASGGLRLERLGVTPAG
ncbi:MULTISPECIES: glycoside hydrolase family 5 protein [unclassified Isoptericola]|uniref:glycoside hydrolase family 5 protein n=1 Tax=unclassified Isoptericola TaxID=2623355 RepID=UPI003658E25B